MILHRDLFIDESSLIRRVYRRVYEIVRTIDHPSLVRVLEVSPKRIRVEDFQPIPSRSLTFKEIADLEDVVDLLESRGVIITHLTRKHLGSIDGVVKLCLLVDAGIESARDPYKWSVKPVKLDDAVQRLRRCDFDSYISGVYKLRLFVVCALDRFIRSNDARRRKERKKMLTTRRDTARDEFRIRHYLQTGTGVDTIPTPALRRYLGESSRGVPDQDLVALLQKRRQERARAFRRQQAHTKKTLRVQSPASGIFDVMVMDSVQLEERPLGEILSATPYNILLVFDGKVFRPALYENRIPEIVYRCVDDRPWGDYLTEIDYFFNIRTFEGDRYLIPAVELPRILVISPTDERVRLISKDAIQSRNVVSALHCTDRDVMRLYTTIPELTLKFLHALETRT